MQFSKKQIASCLTAHPTPYSFFVPPVAKVLLSFEKVRALVLFDNAGRRFSFHSLRQIPESYSVASVFPLFIKARMR
jgi:hypothetical protein